MTKNKLFSSLLLLSLSSMLLISGCKKKETESTTPSVDESGQNSNDNRTAQSENEAAINDINDVIGNENLLRGKSSSETVVSGITGTICGLTVDTFGLGKGNIRLNFNGTTCNNRNRTGSIKLSIQDYSTGKRWKTTGCVIKVTYESYKITRASDGKFIQLDGEQLLTNVSGGTWWELLITKSQSSLVSTVTGTNLKVTFEDGKVATYNINRRFTYSLPNNVLSFKGEGIGNYQSYSNLENFGTTRNGELFTSQVTTPIVWNLTCGPWAPVQGALSVEVVGKGFAVICQYSVDKDGNPIAVSANQCPYGWKVEWTVGGKTGKKVFGYN